MSIKTRFAPSPTGMLHVGNVRTALVNWLFTKANNGSFMLRMDDTDLARSKLEYEQAIKDDLHWLGLTWDSFARQSERLARYKEIKEQLIASGRLYACYETQAELDMKRKMLLGRGLPPIYDRANLKLTPEEHEKLQAQGHKPHYRFLLADEVIEWDDLIRGPIQFHAKNLSDPIVIREDGTMTYILCSAIDDIDFGITHILRGEDHISNTAICIQITKALGRTPPQIGHTSLLQSKTGEISKRLGGFDIDSLRKQFIEPMAINSLLAKMGTSDSIDISNNLAELVAEFDIHKFSSSPVNYDFNELLQLNHKFITNMSYLEIKPSLDKLNITVTEEFWQAVHGNINTINELLTWWNICHKEIEPVIESSNISFLETACKLLPNEPWDNTTWSIWTNKIKEVTGISGKQLFMPLRLAITALDSGPELKLLLPLIDRNKVEQRLHGKIS
jgi:glutamyl-tRNA synthetase